MSNRRQDSLTSLEVEKFLDKNFYKSDSERVRDKERQLQGIDVVYKDRMIDEKCATDYINRPLRTFAFELSSVNRLGQRYLGWLLNPDLKTTHYLICYINKCRVDRNPLEEDIEEMEVIYLEKKAILRYLQEKDLSLENLGKYQPLDHPSVISGLKIMKSGQKTESPVNILIPRDDLKMIGVSTIVRK